MRGLTKRSTHIWKIYDDRGILPNMEFGSMKKKLNTIYNN